MHSLTKFHCAYWNCRRTVYWYTVFKTVYFLRNPVLADQPKKFSKGAPSAPIYINFEGVASAEKTRFFGQNFLVNAFLDFFLKILPFGQNRAQGELEINQFGRPKKMSATFSKFFWKIRPPPPPLEKILDPPLPLLATFFNYSISLITI